MFNIIKVLGGLMFLTTAHSHLAGAIKSHVFSEVPRYQLSATNNDNWTEDERHLPINNSLRMAGGIVYMLIVALSIIVILFKGCSRLCYRPPIIVIEYV